MYRGVMTRAAVAASLVAAAGATSSVAFADTFDDIGVTLLHTYQPTLTGSGVTVAIVEVSGVDEEMNSLNEFQIDPAAAAITSPITYINNTGNTATSFPNIIGTVSGHATLVGQQFNVIASNVTRIYNFEADYFVNHVVVQDDFGADSAMRIINQSFVVPDTSNYYQ
jgi:hypothetical protein